MKIKFNRQSTIDTVYDNVTSQYEFLNDVKADYSGIRKMVKMRSLFKDAVNEPNEKELYYTCGGIAHEQHKQIFHKHNVTYEYTIIPNRIINGERMKTHGHIHGMNMENGTRRLEAFEVLNGKGCFELFKELEDGSFECLIVLLKKGDQLIVPCDYYHLSMNMSDDTFIFSDLIKEDVRTVYSYVKEKNGAPYYVMVDDKGENYYELNDNWKDKNIKLKIVTPEQLPWDNPFDGTPLYIDFISRPEEMTRILEG